MIQPRLLFLYLAGLCWLNPAARAQNDMTPSHSIASFVYAGDDLGAVYRPATTSVKLWAPTAKQVRLLLFNDAPNESFQTVPLSRDRHGVWSAVLNGDQDGKYYLYEVTLLTGAGKPVVYRVNDPYARGCSANSGRTLIYDPRKTNPDGWDRGRFCHLEEQHGRRAV